MKTLLDFTLENGHRIWTDGHLKESQAKIVRFTNFSDFKHRALSDFKPTDVYNFLDHLHDEGLTDSTLNRYTACISAIMKLAVKNEAITHAPQLVWKKVKGKGRPRFFSDAEIKSILNYYRTSKWPYMADMFILGIETGMRLGEILSIESDTSKTQGTISSDGRFVYLTNTKNGNDRNVPLVPAAQEALKRLNNRPSRFFRHKPFYKPWQPAKTSCSATIPTFVSTSPGTHVLPTWSTKSAHLP